MGDSRRHDSSTQGITKRIVSRITVHAISGTDAPSSKRFAILRTHKPLGYRFRQRIVPEEIVSCPEWPREVLLVKDLPKVLGRVRPRRNPWIHGSYGDRAGRSGAEDVGACIPRSLENVFGSRNIHQFGKVILVLRPIGCENDRSRVKYSQRKMHQRGFPRAGEGGSDRGRGCDICLDELNFRRGSIAHVVSFRPANIYNANALGWVAPSQELKHDKPSDES